MAFAVPSGARKILSILKCRAAYASFNVPTLYRACVRRSVSALLPLTSYLRGGGAHSLPHSKAAAHTYIVIFFFFII